MKKSILILLCAMLAVALTGCVSSNAENNATPSPEPATAAPSPSAAAGTEQPAGTSEPMPTAEATADVNAPGGAVMNTAGPSAAPGNAVMSVKDAGALGDKISNEVERLSEIDDAQTVVMGDTAIVAVEFDSQYKGEMTTRIQDMVTDRVKNVDKSIVNVHVTSDPNLYTSVGDMVQSLTSGTVNVLEDIGDDFTALVKKIVPVR